LARCRSQFEPVAQRATPPLARCSFSWNLNERPVVAENVGLAFSLAQRAAQFLLEQSRDKQEGI
jgi:hypothetical protein